MARARVGRPESLMVGMGAAVFTSIHVSPTWLKAVVKLSQHDRFEPWPKAGTKGRRKIGKNCRVMIHGVAGGFGGNLTTMENEIEEIKWIQQQYINCLADETNLTASKLKKMIRRQVDVYLSAEEAVKFGIADEII